MSFHTSLIYYRPCPPPVVAANDLARFISQLREAGVLLDDGFFSLSVKFGDSIDQDDLAASEQVEIAPCLSTTREIEWDVDLENPTSIREVIDALADDDRRIYRAFASLGAVVDAVRIPITRTDSPENEIDFCPDSIALSIEPIEIHDLGSETSALVGWIGVSLSGYGYLFPWTFREILERLEGAAAIRDITEHCRSFWPVSLERVEPSIVELRQQLGDLWPYQSFDKEWDWYWGIQETG